MLRYENRLKKKKEFSFIYKKGKTYYSKYLALYIVSTKANESKVGFSVNNKVGNSVVRHKVKRRLSEILLKNLKTLPIKNYVFVAKIGCETLSFAELTDQVENLLSRAKNEK